MADYDCREGQYSQGSTQYTITKKINCFHKTAIIYSQSVFLFFINEYIDGPSFIFRLNVLNKITEQEFVFEERKLEVEQMADHDCKEQYSQGSPQCTMKYIQLSQNCIQFFSVSVFYNKYRWAKFHFLFKCGKKMTRQVFVFIEYRVK